MPVKNIGRRLKAVLDLAASPLESIREITTPVDDLTRLANKIGSDKGSRAFDRHCYTRVYSRLFAPIRHRPLRMLEIGLLHHKDIAWRNVGARFSGGSKGSRAPSLQLWADYFPNASIYGFDINDFSGVSVERCTIVRGDMGSREDLARLVETTGGNWDIIIDDASHARHHQQLALGVLFKALLPGGIYIIEDLATEPIDLPQPDIPRTQTLMREAMVSGQVASPCLSDAERQYLQAEISSVGLYDSLNPWNPLALADSLAVIVKRGERELLSCE